MNLLTEQLEQRFAELGRQDGHEAIVVCKFFNPTGAGTWYATEYDKEEGIFFGWAEIHPGCGELGYFSLEELQTFRGRFGLGIERDTWFQETPIHNVIAAHPCA